MAQVSVLFFLLWTGSVPTAASLFEVHIRVVQNRTVTLPCRAPSRTSPVRFLEWSRTDLDTSYVLLYRAEKFDPDLQHPSFKDRVDLLDQKMKDGVVSLVLKNVTTGDSGSYECRVVQIEPTRKKRSVLGFEPINVIELKVVPGQIHEDQDQDSDPVRTRASGLEDLYLQEYLEVVLPLMVVLLLLMALIRCSLRSLLLLLCGSKGSVERNL